MAVTGIIGNISRVRSIYPDGRTLEFLGGAAFHTSLAASRAGLDVAPISIIGGDLRRVIDRLILSRLDFSSVRMEDGVSSSFDITYGNEGELSSITCAYGVSSQLTKHALNEIGKYERLHVCCRHPLDVTTILGSVSEKQFSIDFFVSSAREMIASAEKFLPLASSIFVNTAEYEVIQSVTDISVLNRIIVSNGRHAARLMCRGEVQAAALPPKVQTSEVTGAGDTLAGTFLALQAAGYDEAIALQEAVNAASEATLAKNLFPL